MNKYQPRFYFGRYVLFSRTHLSRSSFSTCTGPVMPASSCCETIMSRRSILLVIALDFSRRLFSASPRLVNFFSIILSIATNSSVQRRITRVGIRYLREISNMTLSIAFVLCSFFILFSS